MPSISTTEIQDPHHHPLHYVITAGCVEQAIEMVGGNRPRVEPRQGPTRDISLYRVTWKK